MYLSPFSSISLHLLCILLFFLSSHFLCFKLKWLLISILLYFYPFDTSSPSVFSSVFLSHPHYRFVLLSLLSLIQQQKDMVWSSPISQQQQNIFGVFPHVLVTREANLGFLCILVCSLDLHPHPSNNRRQSGFSLCPSDDHIVVMIPMPNSNE